MKSETADIAIKGGILVSGDGLAAADLFITGGCVDEIGSPGSVRPASKVIDASGTFVLPGLVDAHLHPVYADKIDTLSRAAVCGGITTLIPFVGAVKAWGKTGTVLDAVQDFIEEGERHSVIDFGVHGTLVRDDLNGFAAAIPKFIDRGVVSFKAFLAYSRRGMKLDDDELLRVMEILGERGALLAVHAENGSVLDYLEDKLVARGDLGPEFYPASHPGLAEAEAVFRTLTLAQVARCPVYLPHVSAHESLEVIRLFKRWRAPAFFTETCPHYLALTDEELARRGSLAKMAPPLRKRTDVDALWTAIEEGLIDVIGSDAAGHAIQAKEPIWDNVFKAPYGTPGLESMLSVVYDEGVNRGRITLPRLVRLTSENPARIFGLYPRKGVLAVGSDADVVIFDPGKSHVLPARNPHLKVDYSLYEGRTCLGSPRLVIQRGTILAEGGELMGAPGRGRFVPGKRA